ncbi:MAG: DUF29 domain-containing protein [Deltaproteobacteria bacterium]|nr:DUF29 domain-containing protein [Deltaproteobacteria bacterium]
MVRRWRRAAALRARDFEALDWEHLAEEVEAMARQRREIKDRLITLLTHLLKLSFEPGEVWRHDSWRNSVIKARSQLSNILEDSTGVFQARVGKSWRRCLSERAKLPRAHPDFR